MARVKIPKERRPHEGRVALAPSDVKKLTLLQGHTVDIETDAGIRAGYFDDEYRSAGAYIVSQKDIWTKGAYVLKVKELQEEEFGLVEANSIVQLFPHFHGDAKQRKFFEAGRNRGIVAIPHEALRVDGRSPVLAAMSRCAGEISALMACEYLRQDRGGPGILPSHAVAQILGAGNFGWRAMEVLQGLVKEMHLHNVDWDRLPFFPNVIPHESTPEVISEFLPRVDFVICSATGPGGAPKLITPEMLSLMKPNASIHDGPIDEGGNCTFSGNTTWEKPVIPLILTPAGKTIRYIGISNLPGAAPRSSTVAFSQAVLPFVATILELIDKGIRPESAQAVINAMTNPLKREICR